MRAISSKLNIQIINNSLERLILNFILFSFGALALFYVFLLASMVVNIVERRSLEAEARTLTNEVRNLEVIYLSKTNDIDLTLSHSLGFRETKTTFATRKALGFVNTNSLSGPAVSPNGF